MPIINHPALFTGGSERFNSQPYVNFYAHLMARKQAKEDALDNYYQNLNKGINPAGTRTQDVPQFMEKVRGFREYYANNRDKIKDPRMDNGVAQTEYQSMYQDALNFVQQSKFEEEKKKPLIEILTDPEKRDRIPEQVLMDLHNHDLPLGHENRKSFDISQLSFDPKPFDQSKFLKDFTDIKMSDNTSIVAKDPKNLTQTVSTLSALDDAAKQTIYTRAAGKYATDESFKRLVDRDLTQPEYFDKLNEVFRKNYGENIETPEDLAAAYTLSSLQPSVTKIETKDDIFGRQKQMAAINHAYRLGEKEFEHALDRTDKVTANLWFDDAIDDWTNTARRNQDGTVKPVSVIETQDGWKQGHKIPVTAYLSKTMMKDGKSPDDIFVTTENEYVPVFYKRDDNGLKIINPETNLPEVNKTLTVPESREMFKLDIGGQAGMKQKNIEMSGQQVLKESTTKSSTKSSSKSIPIYKKSDLIGAGWTEAQVKQAVSEGKIKVN